MMRLPRPRSERGQTLIEFAFVLPIILLFILTLVDFGLAVDRREVLQHAVRDGARRGAVGASVAQIVDHTVTQSGGLVEPSDVAVCYVDGDDTGTYPGNPGDNVRVSLEYTYEFTVGGGEILSAFGVPLPTMTMTPMAEAGLETAVAAAVACP